MVQRLDQKASSQVAGLSGHPLSIEKSKNCRKICYQLKVFIPSLASLGSSLHCPQYFRILSLLSYLKACSKNWQKIVVQLLTEDLLTNRFKTSQFRHKLPWFQAKSCLYRLMTKAIPKRIGNLTGFWKLRLRRSGACTNRKNVLGNFCQNWKTFVNARPYN